MEPGASADKNAAFKIVRSIVPVWSAGIRRIAVITIFADRRWAHICRPAIDRPNAYSHSNPHLRVRSPRKDHTKPNQNCIF
jgi:hypothetical protein